MSVDECATAAAAAAAGLWRAVGRAATVATAAVLRSSLAESRRGCPSRPLPSHPLTHYRDLVKLPPGAVTPVVKPLPSFPLREGESVVGANALPHDLLLLDIQQAALLMGGSGSRKGDAGNGSSSSGSGGDSGSGGGGQLYCTVHLESSQPAAAHSPASATSSQRGMSHSFTLGSSSRAGAAAPLRTRALSAGSGGVVAWEERLILALPMRSGRCGRMCWKCWWVKAPGTLACSLACPRCLFCCLHASLYHWHASAPVPTSPVAAAVAPVQTLVFEVWDAAAAGGRGACLGTGRLLVPVRTLQHREEHSAEVACEAAAPAGSSGGSPAQSGQAQGRQGASQGAQLQLSYMLQKQWSFSKAAPSAPGPGAWAGDVSTAGQRALSLASQPGSWAVVPAFGQQRALGGSGGAQKAGTAGKRNSKEGRGKAAPGLLFGTFQQEEVLRYA